LDLVSGDGGDIWVRAGDLSWWREAQVTFLAARLSGRRVRISANPSEPGSLAYRQARSAAEAIGAVVVERRATAGPLRGTLVSPGTDQAAMVVIDEHSRHLLRSPDDRGVLELLSHDLERELGDEVTGIRAERDPQIEPLTETELIASLHAGVSQYADADIAYEDLDVESLRPLTRYLERFKVFRAARLDALQLSYPSRFVGARIKGSPWPITPPVVELRKEGPVVIDGTHRAFMQLRRGKLSMPALVVRGVDDVLPARPLADWEGVTVFNAKLPRHRRYTDYRKENFRPIRPAFAAMARTDPAK
jgi:hypothetical protein